MSRSASNYNPTKPFSSLTTPRMFSPLGPSMSNTPNVRMIEQTRRPLFPLAPPYKPSIPNSTSLFQSIKEGFGFGVGSSIARKFFESNVKVEESKTLETSQPNPPNEKFPSPPIPSTSEIISRQQNSIQQTQNSSSCSRLEIEYMLCLEKNSIELCNTLEKEFNQCISSKK